MLSISDPIKPSTPAAIAKLHAMGLRVVMQTGDNERTARSVADTLGLDDVYARVDPSEKNMHVRIAMGPGTTSPRASR